MLILQKRTNKTKTKSGPWSRTCKKLLEKLENFFFSSSDLPSPRWSRQEKGSHCFPINSSAKTSLTYFTLGDSCPFLCENNTGPLFFFPDLGQTQKFSLLFPFSWHLFLETLFMLLISLWPEFPTEIWAKFATSLTWFSQGLSHYCFQARSRNHIRFFSGGRLFRFFPSL